MKTPPTTLLSQYLTSQGLTHDGCAVLKAGNPVDPSWFVVVRSDGISVRIDGVPEEQKALVTTAVQGFSLAGRRSRAVSDIANDIMTWIQAGSTQAQQLSRLIRVAAQALALVMVNQPNQGRAGNIPVDGDEVDQ